MHRDLLPSSIFHLSKGIMKFLQLQLENAELSTSIENKMQKIKEKFIFSGMRLKNYPENVACGSIGHQLKKTSMFAMCFNT